MHKSKTHHSSDLTNFAESLNLHENIYTAKKLI